jgi:predicted glycoside hydrolase/deacetylase ChbG (UPF0249 family)
MIFSHALMVVGLLAAGLNVSAPEKSLAERLGYKASDRLLIINGDDVGMCHSANVATIDCLENGVMASATIMVPCPWFTEIANYAKSHPEKDFGIHLVHTSEWHVYRWGPVASKSDVPGLVAPDGYLWHTVEDVYKHSTPEQAETEARAQIKMALAAGVDVTHIDSHMGTMQYDPKYHASYVKLAREFNLPLRMAAQADFEKFGQPNMRKEIAALGLVFPDDLIHDAKQEKGESRKDFWIRLLKGLKPGVTELFIHAGLRTDELKATTNSWEERSTDHDLFTSDPDMRKLLDDQHIIRIGYRALRNLQRNGR